MRLFSTSQPFDPDYDYEADKDIKSNTTSLMDNLLAFQAKQIEEHECWQCGRDLPGSELEWRTLRGYDGPEDIQVCKRCISHGWDQWHRG